MKFSVFWVVGATLCLGACGGSSGEGNSPEIGDITTVSDGQPIDSELLEKCSDSEKYSDPSAGVAYATEGTSETEPDEYYVFCFRADGTQTFSRKYVFSTSQYERDREYLRWYSGKGVEIAHESWSVGLSEPTYSEYNESTYDDQGRIISTTIQTTFNGKTETNTYTQNYEELENGAYRTVSSSDTGTMESRYDQYGELYYRKSIDTLAAGRQSGSREDLLIELDGYKHTFARNLPDDQGPNKYEGVRLMRPDGFELFAYSGTGLSIPWEDVRIHSEAEVEELFSGEFKQHVKATTDSQGRLTEYFTTSFGSECRDVSSYEYDEVGRVVRSVQSQDCGDRIYMQEQWVFEYDEGGRVVVETLQENDSSLPGDIQWWIREVRNFSYEDDGRIVNEERLAYYDSSGNYPDRDTRYCKELEYDDQGKLIFLLALGTCGREGGRYFEYDEAGRLIKDLTVGEDGRSPATWVEYDELGRMTQYGEGYEYSDEERSYRYQLRVVYTGPTPVAFLVDSELASTLTAPIVNPCVSALCLYEAGL